MKGMSETSYVYAILAVFLVGGGLYVVTDGFTNLPQPVLGAVTLPSCLSTPLSVSKTDFISNDAAINGNGWLVSFTVNCGGTYLVGTLTDTDTTQGTVTTQYPLEVVTNLQTERLVFEPDGSKDFTALYYKWEKVGPFLSNTDALNNCRSRHPEGIQHFVKITSSGFDYACVWHDNTNPSSYFNVQSIGSSPKIESVTAITYSAKGSGKTEVLTLDEKQTTFKPSSGGNIVGQFGGYTLSGLASLPSMANVILVNGKYTAKSFDPQIAYSDFNICLNTLASNQGGLPLYSGIENCLNNYNNKRTVEKSATVNPLYGGSIAPLSPEFNSGDVIYDVSSKLYAYPIIVSKIKAAWLGIVVPVADIQFGTVDISPGQSCVASGQVGSINAQVRNVGSVSGAVTVTATCDSTTVGATNSKTINAGNTETFTIPITAFNTGSSDVQRSCTVTAQSGSKTITKTITYTACPQVSCTQNACAADGKTLLVCENGQFKSSVTCEFACNPGTNMCSGSVTCADGSVVADVALCPKPPVQLNYSLIFAILAAVLSFLIAGGKGIKERDEVSVAIGGVMGVIAAIVTYVIMENILTFLAGSIILVILGAAALYFFGPALILIFSVIAAIVGKLR